MVRFYGAERRRSPRAGLGNAVEFWFGIGRRRDSVVPFALQWPPLKILRWPSERLRRAIRSRRLPPAG